MLAFCPPFADSGKCGPVAVDPVSFGVRGVFGETGDRGVGACIAKDGFHHIRFIRNILEKISGVSNKDKNLTWIPYFMPRINGEPLLHATSSPG